jgi:hypothetical protein
MGQFEIQSFTTEDTANPKTNDGDKRERQSGSREGVVCFPLWISSVNSVFSVVKRFFGRLCIGREKDQTDPLPPMR